MTSNFIKKQLKDGVTLGIIPTNRSKLDTVLIALSLPIDEDVTKYALLARVLNRGTASYPTTLEISRRKRSLYDAVISAICYRQGETLMLVFTCSTLKQKYAYDNVDIFGGAIDLVNEMIFHPYMPNGSFPEEYIQVEKQMLADKLKSNINNKTSYARDRAVEIMCEGEPYAIPLGRLKDIDPITSDDLKASLEHIRENGGVTMLYAGDMSEAEITEKLGTLSFNGRNAKTAFAVPKAKTEGVKYVTEEMDIAQAKLVMGFKTGITLASPDYIKMALLNEIFGGGTTSKLFMNVREKMSLCYFCSSMTDGHKDVMLVISGIDGDNFEKAQDGILTELENIRNGNISEEEFESARLSLANSYTEITDSSSALCMWYLSRLTANRSDSPEDAVKALEGVTADQVAQTAKNITADTVYLLKGAN